MIEIGCGLGNFTQYILDRDIVVSLDVVDECLDRLRARFPNQPNLVSRSLDVQDPAFCQLAEYRPDSVVCFNVLEQLRDHRAALMHMHQVLEVGGRAVFILPAFEMLYGPIDENLGDSAVTPNPAGRPWRKNADFAVPKARYFNSVGFMGWWVNAKVLRKTEQSTGQIALFDNLIVPPMSWAKGMIRTPVRTIDFHCTGAHVKVSILIPVYNKALTLPLIVQRVLAAPMPPGCERKSSLLMTVPPMAPRNWLNSFAELPL